MYPTNRAARRRADKAVACLARGTKVPGQIRAYLGAKLINALDARVVQKVGARVARDPDRFARLKPILTRKLELLAWRSAGFKPA